MSMCFEYTGRRKLDVGNVLGIVVGFLGEERGVDVEGLLLKGKGTYAAS